MDTTSLWGNIDTQDVFRTPIGILREQAGALTEITNGILQAVVEQHNTPPTFYLSFFIIAPALNNYRIQIVSVRHGLEIYPATIAPALMAAHDEINCDDERSFIEGLAKILSSERTRQVIRSLISQSKALSINPQF